MMSSRLMQFRTTGVSTDGRGGASWWLRHNGGGFASRSAFHYRSFHWRSAILGPTSVCTGVGPKPIPQKRLSAEQLAEAITIATKDVAMKCQAAVLGQHIWAEDGVKRAVEIICRKGAA